ncbi:TauD/TfdA dioxygenase family protein [Candidimonas nitroreducens]|uniref:Taurine dioxygenase n=1 Tax=Candidimonas nitroreducens TaxID=683354 RepID=A0A225MCJ7_9BURK|nr:TauD/TfdA family dioxygenase [Candidimonas nitroreducens]OWT58977.1 taurine dioxygenase [Candidimonas nitroreducens]
MHFNIRRLNPAIGAEITNCDLREPLSADTASAIYQAWLDSNGLLVVRDQHLEPQHQVAFASIFGELSGPERKVGGAWSEMRNTHALPEFPQITRMSNKKDEQGRPLGRVDAGTFWHTDLATRQIPGKASCLYAIEIPPYGGDTMFASMIAAYDALSPLFQERLEGLEAVHTLAKVYGNQMTGGMMGEENEVKHNSAIHPVIRQHPDTGRKSIFVDRGFTTQIEGLNKAESDALLEFLFEHSTQPQFIYRHQWRTNDLLIWDNRCTIHYAVSDYKGIGWRYMHRCTIRGNADIPTT